jgi:hypothetical protein
MDGLYSDYPSCGCAAVTRISGAVQMNADFASSRISGTMTNLGFYTDGFRPGGLNDIGFDAGLDRAANQFRGTTRVTSNPGGARSLSDNATGVITGRFFGPGVEEVGAAFTLSDGVHAIIGSIGGWREK